MLSRMCYQTSIGKETGKVMTLHHLAINLQKWLLYADLGMRLLSLFQTSQAKRFDSKVCKEPSVTPDETVVAKFQEKILTQLRESEIQFDIYDARVKHLRKEVKATLIACGHCDPAYFYPILKWVIRFR